MMEEDMLDGCSPPPAKLSKMIDDEKTEVVANGKLKVTPSVNGGSDQTAQILKDIAILNGHMSEPLEDLCGSFSSGQDNKMETEANGHSGENSVDSGAAPVENGNAQNGGKGGSEDEHSGSARENDKDSQKKDDHKPMDIDGNVKKEGTSPNSGSSKSSEPDHLQNSVAGKLEKESGEKNVEELYDKVLDELDSDHGDTPSPKQKDSKSKDENYSKEKDTDKDDNSMDTTDGARPTEENDNVKNDQSRGEDGKDVGIKIIDLSENESPEAKVAECDEKSGDSNKQPEYSDKQSMIINVNTNASALKEALQKAAPPSDAGSNTNSNVTSVSTSEGKTPALSVKDKKEEDPVLKHSKVNQALTKGPVVEMRPMANALAAIGLDLVREHVYKDLVKLQSKKKSQKKLTTREEEQLDRLKDAHDVVVKKNETFCGHKVLKCSKCTYCTVSKNQLELHKEHAHQTNYGSYECSICDFETKQRNAIAFHMEAEHNRKCKWLTIPWGFYVCPLCPFENNSYSTYNKHLVKCQRQFKLRRNLEPVPGDCDIPIKPLLKPKPLPKPLQPAKKLYPEKSVSSLLAKARLPLSVAAKLNVSLQGKPGLTVNRPFLANQINRIQGTSGVQPQAGQPQQLVQVQGQWYTLFYVNGQAYLSPAGPNPVLGTASPAILSKPMLAQSLTGMVAQQQTQSKYGNTSKQQQYTVHSTAAGRVLAPRQTSLTAPPNIKQKLASEATIQEKVLSCVAGSPTDKSFEICEICGGFVKDSDSLRIHFYWAHKIDIPKPVFGTRKPHLVCGRINRSNHGSCNERYWTYQGLQRHREIVHGEGEAPASRLKVYSCFMCGETNVVSLIGHMRAKHNLAVGSWLRNFKCVCCGLILKTRSGLENHLLALHGDVFITKGLIDQLAGFNTSSTPAGTQAKNNPVPTGMFENTAKLPKSPEQKLTQIMFPCPHCDLKFSERKILDAHIQSSHSIKCNRCSQRFSSKVFLEKHYISHRSDKDACPLCEEKVLIGRPFVRHMKREHMKTCSVVVKKMPETQYEFYLDSWKKRAANISVKTDSTEDKKRGESVIILDSDDESKPDAPSSKRVSDHSTDDEPKTKRTRTEKVDMDTVTVVELNEDGKPSSVVEEMEELPEKVKNVKKVSKDNGDSEQLPSDAEENAKSPETKEGNLPDSENMEESSKKSSKREIEILEVDGETIIVQKEDD